MRLALLALLGVPLSLGLFACGHSESEIAPGIPAADRANYCLYDVSQESDSAKREEFLRLLNGKRTHRISKDEKMILEYQLDGKKVRLWHTYPLWKDVQTVEAKRICVSQILNRHDLYDGFRLVEFEAKNNEGTGTIAVKALPNDGLIVTDYTYSRNGQKERSLISVEKFFYRGEPASPVDVPEYDRE